MRRFLTSYSALAAGLVLFLSGCSGESPTAPQPVPTPGGGAGGGACAVTIALPAGPISAYQQTAITIRAQVFKNGTSVPDNSSVTFTTDFGFFAENGLPTIVKSTRDGAAEVSPGALTTGSANVRASFECGSATVRIDFQALPDTGPFISDVQPGTGSCAGGDVVTLFGGRFGTSSANVSVTFGGAQASIIDFSNTTIHVRTPARTLANPQVPETVDVAIRYFGGVGGTVTRVKAFTYIAIDPNKRVFISAVTPSSGSPNGGEQVSIQGGNFGTSVATTRVTICGLPATIATQSDGQIAVVTPRKTLANPAVSETCDVVVATDLGKCSQQQAVQTQGFTYRGGGGGGTCNTDGSFFLSAVTPNTGPPAGGTVVTITGGGFPTTAGAARVDFGGVAAQITAISANQITVSTPLRTLANPDVPETVDVTVTDLGSPTQRCARLAGAFTYTRLALDPVIYSISPRTGPNDATTRVSIFGTGFQFPMQVFLTSPITCLGQQIEAPIVGSITLTQIVFSAPATVGAYVCLAGQLADVTVLNPGTGKKNTCVGCFKYYGCPTITGVPSPSVIPTTSTSTVTVSGNNFEEPVEATFTIAGSPTYRLTVLSVSSTSVLVRFPPLSTIQPSSIVCNSVTGTLSLSSTGLACNPVITTVTYRADQPTITSVSPSSLLQAGGPVTVLGTNFGTSMTAVVTREGAPIGDPITATVNNSGSLTFTVPFIPDADFNRQNCASGGGQFIPTTFGVRVTNKQTGCTADFPGALVITPANTACTFALTITTGSMNTAIVCTGYNQPITVSGGTPPYFNYTAAGLPAGLTINSSTGIISGIPILTSGAGGSAAGSVTLGVEDTALTTVTKTLPILFSDPTGQFSVTGTSPQSVPATGVGPASAFSVVGGTGAINWSIVSGPAGLSIASPGATSNFISAGLAPGSYSVTVRATDSLSCAPAHTGTVTVTVNSP